MLTKEQNELVLQILVDTLNSEFNEEVVSNLAEYMGGEFTVNPPVDEISYQLAIKQPMLTIFQEVKYKLQNALNKVIYNNPYDPINDNLYLSVGLFSLYGDYYYTSKSKNDGITGNTYENSPLQKNLIYACESSDGGYVPFNGNITPSQINTISSSDPNYVGSSMGYVSVPINKMSYRSCRKLVNTDTGVIGGVLAICLYNVDSAF